MSNNENQEPVKVKGKTKGRVKHVKEEEPPDVSMFGKASEMDDAILVIEGFRIPVIKAVLCLASPVLREIYQTATGEVPEAELLGQSLQDAIMFLTWIYPDNGQILTCKCFAVKYEALFEKIVQNAMCGKNE